MGVFSLLCVFVCLFVCLYGYGFLSGGKDSGVKLHMLVRLISGMSFSHFGARGESRRGHYFWMYASTHWSHAAAPGEAQWDGQNWGQRRRVRPYGRICVLQACRRTCFNLGNYAALRGEIITLLSRLTERCCYPAEDFALSIHGGLTSTDPVLATVWGVSVARSSVEDRCFYSNGTVPSEATKTTRRGVDVGNDTVLVGLRGFYVRLRGYLHRDDAVVFDCWTQLLDPLTSMYEYCHLFICLMKRGKRPPHRKSLLHGQVTISFVVSVCLSVCLFVQSFFQPSSIRFGSN